jgi:hypothetical protein
VQRARGVWKSEYASCFDVIVVSAKGERIVVAACVLCESAASPSYPGVASACLERDAPDKIEPCDVQRARGVWKSEYASCFDVIVVSAKGERSLCSASQRRAPRTREWQVPALKETHRTRSSRANARPFTQPALLSRSPAIQPCDVQRARGVWKSEYASCFDVIVSGEPLVPGSGKCLP